MTDKEVLKLALEALEKQVSMAGGWQSPAEAKAITSIKEALAQPEQEPCCYGGIAHDCHAGQGCRIAERLKAAVWDKQK